MRKDSAASPPLIDLTESLSIDDLVTIHVVQSSYSLIFHDHAATCSYEWLDRAPALVTWSQLGNEPALKLITFFRQIHEFEALHEDDRFLLIKYNLLPLLILRRCLYYDPLTNWCSDERCEDPEKRHYLLTSGSEHDDSSTMYIDLMRSLVQATEQDATLLQLLLVVMLLSTGMSMADDEPRLHDPATIYRAQSHYMRLVWNYLLDKQGEPKTIRQFTQLLTAILRLQSATRQIRTTCRTDLSSRDTVDCIAPVMQTVLHIS